MYLTLVFMLCSATFEGKKSNNSILNTVNNTVNNVNNNLHFHLAPTLKFEHFVRFEPNTFLLLFCFSFKLANILKFDHAVLNTDKSL